MKRDQGRPPLLHFVSPPFAGHLNPQLVLAQAAARAGYRVVVITGPKKLAAVKGLGLQGATLPSLSGEVLEAIANPSFRVGSNPLRLWQQLGRGLRLFPALQAELAALWQEDRPQLVLADSVAAVAGLQAQKMGIAWATTIATPFAMESPTGTPAYCGGWLPPEGRCGEWRDAVGRAAVRSFKAGVAMALRPQLRRLGLERLYGEDGFEAIYSPLAIFGFGIAEFEYRRQWPRQFVMLGPAIAAPERMEEVPLPPSDGSPRVLMTLGTHLLWAKERLVRQAEDLVREYAGFQLTVALGRAEADQAAPDKGKADKGEVGTAWEGDRTVQEETATGKRVPQPRRLQVVSFLPYAKQLPAFDAVIHHGGAGITYACLLAGKPSVVVPQDYDQPDFAARVVHFGAGVRVGSLRVEALGPALQKVLAQQEWPALRKLQQAARSYRVEERFLARVRELAPL